MSASSFPGGWAATARRIDASHAEYAMSCRSFGDFAFRARRARAEMAGAEASADLSGERSTASRGA